MAPPVGAGVRSSTEPLVVTRASSWEELLVTDFTVSGTSRSETVFVTPKAVADSPTVVLEATLTRTTGTSRYHCPPVSTVLVGTLATDGLEDASSTGTVRPCGTAALNTSRRDTP